MKHFHADGFLNELELLGEFIKLVFIGDFGHETDTPLSDKHGVKHSMVEVENCHEYLDFGDGVLQLEPELGELDMLNGLFGPLRLPELKTRDNRSLKFSLFFTALLLPGVSCTSGISELCFILTQRKLVIRKLT